MSIAAKPTRYNDIEFRSRLEARWAAFFDLAGWHWKYEPFDLDEWTPDFILHGAANDILIEVKPIEWIEPEQILQQRDLAKVFAHRLPEGDHEHLKRELLVCGDGPQWVGADFVLGAFADEAWGVAPDWAVLCLGGSDEETAFDFCARNGAFGYRMSGAWDGARHVFPVNDNIAMRAWFEAGNRVQWKGAAAEPGLIPAGAAMRDVVRKLRREEP